MRHIPGPLSSYRLQFNRDFRFEDARALVDYLSSLGVTHCYSSPVLKANPGSAHGYDICSHQRLNPDLGTDADYEAFTDALATRHMGLILDIVPNHMGLDPETNEWWHDVLENGPSSPFADYFDIDWNPIKPELKGKILLPILQDQYGLVLERGELQLAFEHGLLFLTYLGRRLPLDPRESPRVLRHGLANLLSTATEDDSHVREYLSVLTALENLPSRTETEQARRTERTREKEIARERLARLFDRSALIRRHIQQAVTVFNGVVTEPASFDHLHVLLEVQPYRLAHWRTAFDEINYRRFFDVNELGGLRMEHRPVFEAAHALIVRLIGEGRITGLRVDHADGLFDPEGYLKALRHIADRALEGSPADGAVQPDRFYLIAEKVLGAGETLPPGWPIDGTTGYGFLNDVNGVFVDAANAAKIRRCYARFTGRRDTFAEVAHRAKRLIMLDSMASELSVLARSLNRLSEEDRCARDFTLNALRKALVEVIACFPIYRTYVSAAGFSATDREAIDLATDRARQKNRLMEPSVFLFLRKVLLSTPDRAGTAAGAGGAGGPGGLGGPGGPGGNDESARRRLTFAMKFQQYTAPVQAKGVEDTAYYRYNALVSLNEVGGDPLRFGRSVDEFHAANLARLEHWPREMIATSTHDSKRGEDARARINVISEIPDEWRRAIGCWRRTNAAHRTAVDRELAPDRSDEYLFYQTLLGVWPPEPADAPIPAEASPELVVRMQQYMRKAIKEAKAHTTWVNENAAYEGAISRFVEETLTGPGARPFLASFVPFARRVAEAGMLNSLSQLVLKVASPGVADFYQGTEWWDLHLVDPDNRRAVDFAARRAMLESLRPLIQRAPSVRSAPCDCGPRAVDGLAGRVADMLEHWHNARIKMFITACGLRLRSSEGELILHGEYVPLAADDVGASHLVGFARCLKDKALLAIVPRLTTRLRTADRPLPTGPSVWGGTTIELPRQLAGRAFRHLLTGEPTGTTQGKGGSIRAAEVFQTCPVALLWSEGFKEAT